MRSRLMGNIWICTDCLTAQANGEYDPDRPADLPEPLSAIGEAYSVTLGLLAVEHHAECPVRLTGDHNAAECDCERIEFSTWPCDGCGDSHHGSRYAASLWLERHIVTERRYGPEGEVRGAVCSCGDESFPMKPGASLAEVAAGHAVDGVLLPSPSWGHAESV